MRGLSSNSTFMCLWTIYIFPDSAIHLLEMFFLIYGIVSLQCGQIFKDDVDGFSFISNICLTMYLQEIFVTPHNVFVVFGIFYGITSFFSCTHSLRYFYGETETFQSTVLSSCLLNLPHLFTSDATGYTVYGILYTRIRIRTWIQNFWPGILIRIQICI